MARSKERLLCLASNCVRTSSETLDEYLSRVHNESVIKDAKSFEKLMPIRKWTDRTVRGKTLHDIFDMIVRYRLLAATASSELSIGDLLHSVEALECFLDPQGVLRIATPIKKAREAYEVFGQEVPASIELSAWQKAVLSAFDEVPVL